MHKFIFDVIIYLDNFLKSTKKGSDECDLLHMHLLILDLYVDILRQRCNKLGVDYERYIMDIKCNTERSD